MEDYEYIQNMPIVRRLRDDNKTMRRKNKDLKRKNKELTKLVKLVFSNLELLQPSSKNINNVINSNIKVKQEPLCSPYEPAIIDDDVEIVAPHLNEIINLSLINNEEGEEEEDRFVKCDNCEISVDCHKNSIHIVYKGEPENLIDEKTLCTTCFHEQEDVLIEQGYNCDDWSIEEGEDEGSNGEDSPVEEEVVEDEGSNGGDSPVEEVDVDEEDEEEVEEVTIQEKMYYTTNKENGLIYGIDEDGEISVEVGKFNNGKPKFYKK